MVPWIAGPLGKKANAGDHRLRVTFMAHSIPGAGINAPLGLPWLDTGVDWNLTCYHLGLLAVKARFGFIPANLTYVFDGGDGNMSRALVLFAGALVGQGKFVSIELVRAFVGHGHGLSDGDIGHLSQKRSGYTVLTLQDFINKLLPKAFGPRLLASPLCAYQLKFKEILDKYKHAEFDTTDDGFSATRRHQAAVHLGPNAPSVRVQSDDKQAEIHAVKVRRNPDDRVAMWFKTRHDLEYDLDWQPREPTSDELDLYKRTFQGLRHLLASIC